MDDFLPPPPSGPPPLLAPDALHHLCTHGYVGLDLPQHLAGQYDRLLATIDAFFAQPLDAKLPYRPGVGKLGPNANRNNTERGYTFLGGEKEYLTLRKSMTHLPPGLRDVAAPVWHDTARLLHRILGDIGVYLDLPPGPMAWDAVVADSLVPSYDGAHDASDPRNTKKAQNHPRDDPPTLLRLFRYEPGGGGAEKHRDLGLLTLCVCWGKGLQVSPQPAVPPPPAPPQEPEWVDAPRVTVMTGDTLHVLSSYRIPSALHRVVVDKDEKEKAASPTYTTPAHRRSIVFALRATTAGDIDLEAFGGQGSVGARDLYDRIRQQRVNINAAKEARDAMRTEYWAKHGQQQGAGGAEPNGVDVATDDDKGKCKSKAEDALDDDADDAIEGALAGVA